MKQYIKYIILFIILVFIGIVGVNLYNNKNFQDSNITTPKVTSKEKNSTNSNIDTKQEDKTNEEENKEIKKTPEENTTTSTKNNKNETTTSNASSNTQSSSSTNNTSNSNSSNSDSTKNTTSQSNSSNMNTPNNNSSNTTQKNSSGYNVLDVDASTNTQSSTNNNSSNSSISTYDTESNASINVSTSQNNDINDTESETENILDVEIDNSSPTKSITKPNTSSNSSNSSSNSNSNSSNNNTNNNNTSNSTNNTSNNTTTTEQKIIKDGDVIGATGYGAVPSMNVLRTKPNSNSTVITRIELNSPFRIIGKSSNGNWWKVKYKGKYGYVDNTYCLINLPDYIPSITYYIVDAEKDNSVSSGVKLSIYGKKLYASGKVYNQRLERDEYIVPVTYSFAKKILKAQKLALKDGYSLKIYDAYRPTSVATQVRDSLAELYNNNATVRKNINYSFENGNTYEWGQGWFIAQNLSAHSLASAIDVSLTKKGETKSLKMPSQMNELSAKSIKYRYGVSGQTTVRNDLYSSNMTPAAKRLDAYMMNSGLTSLASEWWHFQDNVSYSRMKEYIPNGLNFQPTKIVSKKIN